LRINLRCDELSRLAADGKYELAASLLASSETRFDHSQSVAGLKRLISLKLMEKYQNTDPFKYILYSAKIGEQTRAMAGGQWGSRSGPLPNVIPLATAIAAARAQ
jgi:hypothetical protein